MSTTRTVSLAAALLAAVVLSACSGSSYDNPMSPSSMPSPTPPSNTGADLVVVINGMNGAQSYSPSPTTLTVGKKVAFYNADGMVHTATADGGAFDTGNLPPGGVSATITLTAVGSFPYHCTLHPTMVGTLTVVAGS